MRRRTLLAVVCVLVACVLGGGLALSSFRQERRLSVGTVELSVSPLHHGALDLYVPLLDWGVRFGGVRLPARLQIQAQAVDRRAAARLASGGQFSVVALRHEARDAIAGYLLALALVAAAAALALGLLVALALRPLRGGVRLRWTAGAAGLGAVAWALAIAFLLAPRGSLDNPTYYARGSDIPVALRTAEAVERAGGNLSQEIDAQLLGLARLVEAPGRRTSLEGLPHLTIASDLHNDVVALPTLRRAAGGGPVLFPGDLTDTGSPLEATIVRRIVKIGHPLVFTAGNHDSDTLSTSLAQSGAIVLTQDGRLKPDGGLGPVVVTVDGLRVAGYSSPNERRARDGYRDRGAAITPAQQADFLAWLMPLVGRVDVVLVHEPALAEGAIGALREDPPDAPLLFVTGHTHRQAVDAAGGVVEVNGGTLGGGGTGNLVEGQDIGLARVTFVREPFDPLAVDLVRVDPGTGAAVAQRLRLDQGPVSVEG